MQTFIQNIYGKHYNKHEVVACIYYQSIQWNIQAQFFVSAKVNNPVKAFSQQRGIWVIPFFDPI